MPIYDNRFHAAWGAIVFVSHVVALWILFSIARPWDEGIQWTPFIVSWVLALLVLYVVLPLTVGKWIALIEIAHRDQWDSDR